MGKVKRIADRVFWALLVGTPIVYYVYLWVAGAFTPTGLAKHDKWILPGLAFLLYLTVLAMVTTATAYYGLRYLVFRKEKTVAGTILAIVALLGHIAFCIWILPPHPWVIL